MLRVESNTKLEEFEGFTEFEDGLLFDEDIPGFCSTVRPFIYGLQREMSIASVHHPAELHSNHSSLTTLSHSLEDLKGASWNSPPLHSDHVMTIEELRSQMTSCFTCGVSWNDKHVSLDCKECGGYALERPCPECEGACGSFWKRDLSMSHASSKARWEGECAQSKPQQQQQPPTSASSDVITAQELSTKLEKLSANS